MQRIAVIGAVAVSLSAWSARAAPTNIKSVEAAAHGAYVAAINSNDTETLLADLNDDIVYQAPSEPEIVGKDAVRKCVAGYFDAYRTTWEKTSIGFTVIGDWAFERYEYKSTDVDKKTGAVTTDANSLGTPSRARCYLVCTRCTLSGAPSLTSSLWASRAR
jgi:ketosteroid isomerase-like protein